MSRGLVQKDEDPSAATASAMLRREARGVRDVSFAHLVRTHVAVWHARDELVLAAGGRSLKPSGEELRELAGNVIHLSADALDARSPWHHSFTSTQV